MYILIEKNNYGALEIKINALNKLIQRTILMGSNLNASKINNLEVLTNLHHDNLLYLLIKIKLKDRTIMLDETNINNLVEEAIIKTLNIKPKNIAIAYIN